MASRQAGIVRTFLDELEERVKKTAGEHELPEQVRDWLSWARNRADATDPVFSAVDKLVAENSSLHECILDFSHDQNALKVEHLAEEP